MNDCHRMTVLAPSATIHEVDLAAAYPWPIRGRWVRAMMVTTLDGGSVGTGKRSGSISSPADRAVMAQVRRHCDAILIGASTFRAERYRPQRPSSQIQQERRTLGLQPAPRLVLVSLSLDLPWDEAAFQESTVVPLVLTAGTCEPAALRAARRHAEVAVLPGVRVDVADLIRSLEDRGLNRVLCEGGPHLLAQIARAGVLDELDLAVSPLMGGGQIVLGEPDLAPARFHLVQVLTAESFLFTRYLRVEPGTEPLKGSA